MRDACFAKCIEAVASIVGEEPGGAERDYFGRGGDLAVNVLLEGGVQGGGVYEISG